MQCLLMQTVSKLLKLCWDCRTSLQTCWTRVCKRRVLAAHNHHCPLCWRLASTVAYQQNAQWQSSSSWQALLSWHATPGCRSVQQPHNSSLKMRLLPQLVSQRFSTPLRMGCGCRQY